MLVSQNVRLKVVENLRHDRMKPTGTGTFRVEPPKHGGRSLNWPVTGQWSPSFRRRADRQPTLSMPPEPLSLPSPTADVIVGGRSKSISFYSLSRLSLFASFFISFS